MPRKPSLTTLEAHRAAVDRALDPTGARARARTFCTAQGIEIPEWCATRPPGKDQSSRREPHAPETDEAEPTIEIEPALAALRSAWRGPSRAFALRSNSVTLIDLSQGASRRAATFGTVDAALKAIAADAIKWAPLRIAERLGFRAFA